MPFKAGSKVKILNKKTIPISAQKYIGQEAELMHIISIQMWKCKTSDGKTVALYEQEFELLGAGVTGPIGPTTPRASALQTKKQYGTECPCGIATIRCIYHRS
jgi:hypothetical protein